MDDNMDDNMEDKTERKVVWRDPFYFSWKLHTPRNFVFNSDDEIQKLGAGLKKV